MKIVIAPQSFKGTLSAFEVAAAMEEGVLRAAPDAEVVKVPVADGGDGTLDVLVNALGAKRIESNVMGPAGHSTHASWAQDGKTAIIELAQASGFALLKKEELNPLTATTFGTGELIQKALNTGCNRIIITLGGSGTHDVGAGIFQALGGGLFDRNGDPLPLGGGNLLTLDRIDLSTIDSRLCDTEIIVGCDVINLLLGSEGAAAIYAPQKGADQETVEKLETATRHFADVVQKQLGRSITDIPCGGAAGGAAAGMAALLGATLVSGANLVLDEIHFSEKIQGADLVITGEGCMDKQTTYEKAPIRVAEIAKEQGIPVVAINGTVDEGFREVFTHGIEAIFLLNQGKVPDSIQSKKRIIYLSEKILLSAIESASNFFSLHKSNKTEN